MTIAVIAANGRTGKEFVKIALQHGHTVRAGVLGEHGFPSHKNLTVITCDATSPKNVEKLLKGSDAVASFIGHGKDSPATVQTDAIDNAISVCTKLKIKRLISLTGTGVRYPGDIIPLIDRFLNFGVNIVDPKRVEDGKKHVKALEVSQLDFTVLRVLKLTNSKPTPYYLTTHGPVKTFTSRQEVAQAALEVLENKSFSRQAPILSKG